MKKLLFLLLICLVGCGNSKLCATKETGRIESISANELCEDIAWLPINSFGSGREYEEFAPLADILTETEAKRIFEELLNNRMGEIFITSCYHEYGYDYYGNVASECSSRWIKFSKEDIDDEYDGGLKINGNWYDKQYIIYYDDQYKELRKEIEERIKEKEKKKK